MKDLPQGLMASLNGSSDKKAVKLRERLDQMNKISLKIQKQNTENTSCFSGGDLTGTPNMNKSPRYKKKI